MKIIWLLVFAIFSINAATAKTSQEVWKELCDTRSTESGSYQYVDNNPELPNVLIYGDSISVHYTPYVRKDLEGQANVYRLYCNGTTSGSFIGKMTRMNDAMRDEALENPWDFQWDVIHFNVGLHDIKYMNKNHKLDVATGEKMTTPERYEQNLRSIIEYLKETAPNATLIFATTTPVPENTQGRVLGEEIGYNEIALKVMKDYPDVIINDLYAFTVPHQQEWWVKPDDVHYNEKGREAQGQEVADFISKALAQRKADAVSPKN